MLLLFQSNLLIAADGGNLAAVRAFLARSPPPDLEASLANGQTALHLAVARGHVDVAAALLEAKANVNARILGFCRGGVRKPVDECARQGNVAMLELLINHRAELNDGALVIAAKHGSRAVCEALIHAGANPNQLGPLDDTALKEAAMAGDLSLSKFLVGLRADPKIGGMVRFIVHVGNAEVASFLAEVSDYCLFLHDSDGLLCCVGLSSAGCCAWKR